MSRLDCRGPFLAAAAAVVLLLAGSASAQAYSGSIVLFDGNNGTGASVHLEGSVPNLNDVGFNDRANSIYVGNGTWELCEDKNYKDDCGHYGPGLHNLGIFANSISSLRPIDSAAGGSSKGGFLAFRDYDGEGDLHRVKGDAGDLTKVPGFNDTISSIAIWPLKMSTFCPSGPMK